MKAKVCRRIVNGIPIWGVDHADGFTGAANWVRTDAEETVLRFAQYESSEGWLIYPIADCPLVPQEEKEMKGFTPQQIENAAKMIGAVYGKNSSNAPENKKNRTQWKAVFAAVVEYLRAEGWAPEEEHAEVMLADPSIDEGNAILSSQRGGHKGLKDFMEARRAKYIKPKSDPAFSALETKFKEWKWAYEVKHLDDIVQTIRDADAKEKP